MKNLKWSKRLRKFRIQVKTNAFPPFSSVASLEVHTQAGPNNVAQCAERSSIITESCIVSKAAHKHHEARTPFSQQIPPRTQRDDALLVLSADSLQKSSKNTEAKATSER